MRSKLGNAWRSSPPGRYECWLHADDRGDTLVVEVRDDGIGGVVLRPGGGLEGIADRAAALDGTFMVESRAGGTVVRIEIPTAG